MSACSLGLLNLGVFYKKENKDLSPYIMSGTLSVLVIFCQSDIIQKDRLCVAKIKYFSI